MENRISESGETFAGGGSSDAITPAAIASVEAEVAKQHLNEASAALYDASKQVCSQIQEICALQMAAADRYVRTSPYQALGVAFALGLVLGCMSRK